MGVSVEVDVEVDVAVAVGVGVSSSSAMVNVAGLGMPTVAFTGSERVNRSVSFPSGSASSRIGTVKAVVVTPGGKVIMPAAVR